MNVLVFTTLFPNREFPQHGIFVERRLQELQLRTAHNFVVVAPVPWFPLGHPRFGEYSRFKQVPAEEMRGELRVIHPRYLVVPALSWRIAPYFIAAGVRRSITALLKDGFEPDLIDAHFAFPDGLAAANLGDRLGVPTVVTARGSDINDAMRYFLPRRQLQSARSKVGHWIAVSRQLESRLRDLLGPAAPISMLPNGVDHDIFVPEDRDAARQELGLSGKVLLMVGRLRSLKGQHLVVDAVREREDVSLLLIGDGEERSSLERKIAEAGLSDRIHLLGEIKNDVLPRYYSAADGLVLASSSEGCPNVVLEAMACGCPVVATAVGAVPDLLPPQMRGLLTETRSSSAIGEKIDELLKADIDREIYVRRAREFDWQRTAAGIERIFERLVP